MNRNILRYVNKKLGPALCLALFLFDKCINIIPKCNKNERYNNILVIKIAGMGDTILMLPALHALKKAFPRATVSVLATPITKATFERCSVVDYIICFDILGQDKGIANYIKLVRLLRQRKFDLIFDMEQHFELTSVTSYLTGARRRVGFSIGRYGRGLVLTDRVTPDYNQHMVVNFLNIIRCLGVKTHVDSLVPIDIPDSEKLTIKRWMKKNNILDNRLKVGIQATSYKSGVTGKQIDPRRWLQERFAIIADKLIQFYDAIILFTGVSQEYDAIEEIISLMEEKAINAAGATASVGELAALVSELDLVICNDSAMSHVAAAMGVPTVALFGPETPVLYAPFGNNHLSIIQNTPCSPCSNIFRGIRCITSCPYNPAKCMTSISVEDVWEAIEKQLGHILAKKRKIERSACDN